MTEDERTNDADLFRMIQGYQVTQALYVAARLEIPDLLAEGPQPVSELATRSGAHAPSLARLLRALSALGVFVEVQADVFGLTPLSETLRSGVPRSRRAWLIFSGSDLYESWGHLLHSVRTGETTAQHLHGMSSWEWRAQHPESNAKFNDAMSEGAAGRAAAITEAYDFSVFGTLIDVGGGSGTLIAEILRAYAGVRGVVVDLPHVVEGAEEIFAAAGVADRASVVSGDFFKEVPDGGDAYILSFILHDWDDEQATVILGNCRRAMGQRSTLLLIERVLPAGPERPWEPYFSDLNMMQALGGRERSEAEWGSLLGASGFAITSILPTGMNPSIIEARPV